MLAPWASLSISLAWARAWLLRAAARMRICVSLIFAASIFCADFALMSALESWGAAARMSCWHSEARLCPAASWVARHLPTWPMEYTTRLCCSRAQYPSTSWSQHLVSAAPGVYSHRAMRAARLTSSSHSSLSRGFFLDCMRRRHFSTLPWLCACPCSAWQWSSISGAQVLARPAFSRKSACIASSRLATSCRQASENWGCERFSCRHRIMRPRPGLTSAQNTVISSEQSFFSLGRRRMSRAASSDSCSSSLRQSGCSFSRFCRRHASVRPSPGSTFLQYFATSWRQASASRMSLRKSATSICSK
mmetsp:Transcript_13911/g.41984  ORF Transcript_13911/g.41984 Transcript_13911/m.41984 type:complete len:305 (+) Transcript_13911:1775-2689(+)